MNDKCECGKYRFMPIGNPKSKYLVVIDSPSYNRESKRMTLLGAGEQAITTEFMKAGMDVHQCRVVPFWLHEPDDTCDVTFHSKELAKEMKGKEFVLFLGKDVVQTVLQRDLEDISGLEVGSTIFKKNRIFCGPAITMACSDQPIGEFRFAITNFVEAINE